MRMTELHVMTWQHHATNPNDAHQQLLVNILLRGKPTLYGSVIKKCDKSHCNIMFGTICDSRKNNTWINEAI